MELLGFIGPIPVMGIEGKRVQVILPNGMSGSQFMAIKDKHENELKAFKKKWRERQK